MDETWQRIEGWLSLNAKPVARSLRKRATDKDVARAERALGRALPEDFRQSLARHDGQQLNEWGSSPGLVYGRNLFPISKSLEIWQMLAGLLDEDDGRPRKVLTYGPVRAVWWDRLWWPIGESSGNDFCCLDLHPAPRGRVGQVIQFWSQNLLRSVLAKSFGQWLGGFADELDAREFIYSEGEAALIPNRDVQVGGRTDEPPAASRAARRKGGRRPRH